MSVQKLLDGTGLSYLWNKIKEYVLSKLKSISADAIDDIFLEDGYVLPDQMYLMNTITEDELVDAFNGIIPPDYPLNEKADTIKESEIQELFS